MKGKPLVSILMTAYNREQFIGEAIASVLAIDYNNFELIIVDDGSKDQTVSIIQTWLKKDSKIRFFRNDYNLGDYPNRNRAASYAKGKYIMYVDSDDRILNDGFQKCVEAMEAFPNVGVGMQFNIENDKCPFFMDAVEVLNRHFFENPCLMIGPGGTILRRSFFEQIGGYPEKYGPANDMYFNLKAAILSGILFLPFKFSFYRIHEGQEINNKYAYLYCNFNYLRDALKELDLPLTPNQKEWIMNKNRRRFFVNLVKYFLSSRNVKKTLYALRESQFRISDLCKALIHPTLTT
jgi:glycosyltransferase involved in cell wall biosynthesis